MSSAPPTLTTSTRDAREASRSASARALVDGRSPLASQFTRHEYMTKQGAVVKNWKRRYFSLHPEKMQIAYYKSAADCVEKRKPLGIITLEDARARRADYDPKREYMFEIYYPKYPKRRVFKIVAQSQHTVNCWMETVNQLTSQDRSTLTNYSIAQGEVEIEENLTLTSSISEGAIPPRSPSSPNSPHTPPPSSSRPTPAPQPPAGNTNPFLEPPTPVAKPSPIAQNGKKEGKKEEHNPFENPTPITQNNPYLQPTPPDTNPFESESTNPFEDDD